MTRQKPPICNAKNIAVTSEPIMWFFNLFEYVMSKQNYSLKETNSYLFPFRRDGVSNIFKEDRDSVTELVTTVYEAVSEWVTGRLLCEEKTHITGLTISDPNILVQKEPSHLKLSSHA